MQPRQSGCCECTDRYALILHRRVHIAPPPAGPFNPALLT